MSIEREPVEIEDVQAIRDEAVLLSEQAAQKFYTPERKDQIIRRMNHLFFELDCRNGKYD